MIDEPAEIVDGELVLGDGNGVEALRRPGSITPVIANKIAVVGAGVVAGAAAMALVHRRRARRVARRRRRVLAPVLASRSFLVDVHVLGDRK